MLRLLIFTFFFGASSPNILGSVSQFLTREQFNEVLWIKSPHKIQEELSFGSLSSLFANSETLIIGKVWYLTNVAYGVYFLFFAVLCYLYFRARNASIKKQNEHLSQLVRDRTAKLQRVTEELEETVEKRTEDLQAALKQLHLAMEAGEFASFIWYNDEQGEGKANYSDLYFEMRGYKPQEIQLDYENWRSSVHPEDVGRVNDEIIKVIESQSTESPLEQLHIKYRLKHKSGKYIRVDVHGMVYDGLDAYKGKVIVGLISDITESVHSQRMLKLNEEKLRYAMEASEDAFIDWNWSQGTFEFSPILNDMLGYEAGDLEQSVNTLAELINPEDLHGTSAEWLRKIGVEINEKQVVHEMRMRKKDGTWLWVLLKAKAVKTVGARNKRIVGTISDLSKEKQRTRERLETILKTEDNERSRISKEIHNGLHQDLTVAALNFEFLHKEVSQLSLKGKDKYELGWGYLQKAIVESRTIAQTLMPKAIHDFGLASACASLVMEYQETIGTIQFYYDDNFGENEVYDQSVEVTFYRILQEALNNIQKYAQATVVNVQLRSYEDILMMTIEDNGIGFNLSEVKLRGEGFGIKSMQNRIDAISGHLEIDTAPGRGTVLIVEVNRDSLNQLK